MNRKRVQRIWREEGFRVPSCAPKRRRLGESTIPGQRLGTERPNHIWALDFLAVNSSHIVSTLIRAGTNR